MHRSTDRILTTHVGSLIRPPEVVELTRGRPLGKAYSEAERATLERTRRQEKPAVSNGMEAEL